MQRQCYQLQACRHEGAASGQRVDGGQLSGGGRMQHTWAKPPQGTPLIFPVKVQKQNDNLTLLRSSAAAGDSKT